MSDSRFKCCKHVLDKKSLINKIVQNLTPDLLKPQFRKNAPNNLWGHCYVASEVFYHLYDNKYRPMRIKVGDINHWFLKNEDTEEVVDITAKQFDFDLDYSKSVRASFLTKEPSKRAKELIKRVLK